MPGLEMASMVSTHFCQKCAACTSDCFPYTVYDIHFGIFFLNSLNRNRCFIDLKLAKELQNVD